MTGTAAVIGLLVAITHGDRLMILNEDFQRVKARLAEIDASRNGSPSASRSAKVCKKGCFLASLFTAG